MKGSFQPISKKWHEYLWIASIIYFGLGLFNILFAWLGLICILTPVLSAIFKSDKSFCYTTCPRSKILDLLGGKFKLSRNRKPPQWLSSKIFRNLFMWLYFGSAFIVSCTTIIIVAGRPIRDSIRELWQFYLPWTVRHIDQVPFGLATFAMASYASMMISLILSLITMIIYRPRTWCAYCPMGTLTQNICDDNAKEEARKLAKAIARQQNEKERKTL